MYRRALVLSLAGFAGCTGVFDAFGGRSGGSSRELSDDGSNDEDATATGTAANESTPSGSAADSTVSQEALTRMSVEELLALAREQAALAIEAYAGAGRPLTTVQASSDDFDPAPVIHHLSRSRRAFETADRQGISAAQEETINRLETFEALVRLFIDLQVSLIESHNALTGLRTAVERVSPQSASSFENSLISRRNQVKKSVSDLSVSRFSLAVGAVDALASTEYQNKRSQFVAEFRVLDELLTALPAVVEGIRLFSTARSTRDSGSPYTAADLAREAEKSLGKGVTGLSAARNGAPRAGTSYLPVLDDLIEATRTTQTAAREFNATTG